MKKLLLLFAFANSFWAFGQLTYSFDVEYYQCSSQYCMPNTNIVNNGLSGEHFDTFEWSISGNSVNFRNATQYPSSKDSLTIPIDDEFQLVYHYEYLNSLYTLDSKLPPRSLYNTNYYCYCDYEHYYPADIFNGAYANDDFWYFSTGDKYRNYDLGIAKGRISFQERLINWHYESIRYPYNSGTSSKTQDYLVIKLPFSRKTGSNCYNSGNYSGQEYRFSDNIQERDYCIECSIVTGGIAYDGGDDVADGHIEIKNFRPNNLVIKRLDKTSIDILAGEELGLEASTPAANTTNLFPDFVYNWQYSVDGGITWQNVPDLVINGHKTNKTNLPVFTMQQILGDNHVDYFGPIDFRLGYGVGVGYGDVGDRPFTSSLHLNYVAGAPVASIVECIPPDCSGDTVKSVDVFFDRNLYAGEALFPLHIIPYPKKDGDTPLLVQNLVTNLIYDPIKEKYKFSFIIPTENNKLTNNTIYTVEYQALLNGEPKGTLAVSNSFLYKDPAPLTFSLAKTDPLCHNEYGKATLIVSGGTPPYSYIRDNETEVVDGETRPKKNSFTGTTTIIEATSENLGIKVLDSNNCIDKTATQ